jgi:hypothetical protein
MPELERKTREAFEERLRELAVDVKDGLDKANPDAISRIVTDAILVIGARHYNDEGQCVGTVYGFSLEGSMPGYVARGLLADAIDDMIQDADE